ncbi:hypothetical protein [uncultured Pseudoteredinibacter sp.]|uniref:hypothetical protein n=1 Tax=uncultured Pseudoteredinibacter sp. TaxID=1641701 RepID=UPI0026231EF0|nr:hypothetical protein [uncultured Pseudoteredinibacter sp.]
MDIKSSGDGEPFCPLPLHPFFEQSSQPASLTDCLDAVNKANSVIEMVNSLEIGDENGGLSEQAMFGYYWVNALIQSALTYVSARLNELHLELDQQTKNQSLISGLIQAIETLEPPHQEELLSQAALQAGMDITAFLETLKDIAIK